ncbi:hypothetical protein ES703_55221 [subsurface metagenome]
MVWNLLIHIIAGILGRNIFTLNFHGILWCLLIATIVQGIDMIRVYNYHKKRIERTTLVHIREEKMRNFKRRAPIIMPQIYIVKVLFYGAVTFAVAAIAR